MVPGMNVNGCVVELMYIPYAREALLRLGGPWSSRFTKKIVAFSYRFHLPSTISRPNTYREHSNRSDIPIADFSHPSHAIGAYLRRLLLAMVVWVVAVTTHYRWPLRSLQISTKSPRFAVIPWHFSLLPRPISYASVDHVKHQWLGVNYLNQPLCR